jgi:hypothetical protein
MSHLKNKKMDDVKKTMDSVNAFHAFKPFIADPKAEVLGKNILLFIECYQGTKSSKIRYLTEVGIISQTHPWPQEDRWYSEQKWLNAIQLVSNLGQQNLLFVSKEIIKRSKFPPHVTDMKSAFESVDAAYHYNNRGNIGYYKVLPSKDPKVIRMETNHPYPIQFDEGIFIGIVERFCPPSKKNLVQTTTAAISHIISHKKNFNGTIEYTITLPFPLV